MGFRHAYSEDQAEVSLQSGISFQDEEDMAQQQFREECDINTIVRRFGLTGKVPVGFAMPRVGDFTQVGDFHEAMNAIVEAEQAFLQVPGELRARFNHDPQQLMAFLEDPSKRDEATELGFFKKPDVPRET